MEILLITILSIFAFIGVFNSLMYFARRGNINFAGLGLKLFLYLPQNSASKLEGAVRIIFENGFIERLYLLIPKDDAEALRIAEELKTVYPIEVLPEDETYCMIKNIDKS